VNNAQIIVSEIKTKKIIISSLLKMVKGEGGMDDTWSKGGAIGGISQWVGG
jgi:hypothetical protein